MYDENVKCSRRNFIKTTAVAGAAASLGGFPLKDLAAREKPGNDESSKKELIQAAHHQYGCDEREQSRCRLGFL
jgi:hypothetical protein